MYTYIYAAALQRKKYESELAAIETSLGLYGISGETRRLSNFLTLDGIIRDLLKKKTPTAVVVGDDASFFDAMNFLAGSRAVLGFIPIEKSRYGEILGMPQGQKACEVLAARRLETLDLGKMDKKYFLDCAYTETPVKILLRSENFFIQAKERMHFGAANLGFGSPTDGHLEALIFKKTFLGDEWEIYASVPLEQGDLEESGALRFIFDGCRRFTCLPKVAIEPKAIRLVVGKGRVF